MNLFKSTSHDPAGKSRRKPRVKKSDDCELQQVIGGPAVCIPEKKPRRSRRSRNGSGSSSEISKKDQNSVALLSSADSQVGLVGSSVLVDPGVMDGALIRSPDMTPGVFLLDVYSKIFQR